MSIVFLDVETTGLDPAKHQVWEIAYAIDNGPIESAFVPHNLVSADADALQVGGYWKRINYDDIDVWHDDNAAAVLEGNTLCCANPAFDAAFLRARWGAALWHYRLFDIEAYAMGALGHETPQGLATIRRELVERGHDITEPDHTAAQDVATLRECHRVLRGIYGVLRAIA